MPDAFGAGIGCVANHRQTLNHSGRRVATTSDQVLVISDVGELGACKQAADLRTCWIGGTFGNGDGGAGCGWPVIDADDDGVNGNRVDAPGASRSHIAQRDDAAHIGCVVDAVVSHPDTEVTWVTLVVGSRHKANVGPYREDQAGFTARGVAQSSRWYLRPLGTVCGVPPGALRTDSGIADHGHIRRISGVIATAEAAAVIAQVRVADGDACSANQGAEGAARHGGRCRVFIDTAQVELLSAGKGRSVVLGIDGDGDRACAHHVTATAAGVGVGIRVLHNGAR